MIDMREDEFEVLVEEGINAIDPKYRPLVKNVAVVIEPLPSAHHRQVAGIELDMTLYGLYEGIPLPLRGDQYMFTVPDKISIFRGPILESAGNTEEAREIVKNTVWHEFAHYFGFNEYEVRQREVKDGRDKH